MDGRDCVTAGYSVLAISYLKLVEAKEPLLTKRQAVHLSKRNGIGDEVIVRLAQLNALSEASDVLL